MKKCAIIPAKDNRNTLPIHELAIWIIKVKDERLSIGITDEKGNNCQPLLIIEIKELLEALKHIGAISHKEGEMEQAILNAEV